MRVSGSLEFMFQISQGVGYVSDFEIIFILLSFLYFIVEIVEVSDESIEGVKGRLVCVGVVEGPVFI